jgi:hypothetical protein
MLLRQLRLLALPLLLPLLARGCGAALLVAR